MQQQDKDHAPAERKTRYDEKRLAGERGEARCPSSTINKYEGMWALSLAQRPFATTKCQFLHGLCTKSVNN
jgi:hypothetical protein